jgi:hypothetical protein
VALFACHVFLPLHSAGREQGPPDSRTTDAAAILPDAHSQEGLPVDVSTLTDTATKTDNVAGVDLTTLTDTATKTDTVAGVDLTSKKDAFGVDSSTQTACTSGASEHQVWPSKLMKVCVTTLPTVSQCTAEAVCNAGSGWHLCTATEYMARGGKTLGYPTPAWIKGCVRSANNPNAPTDQRCPACTMKTAPTKPIAWDCTTSLSNHSSDYLNTGLVTAVDCSRVGVNDPSTEGRWLPRRTFQMGYAAVCCQ